MFVRRLSIMMGTRSAMQTRKGAYAIHRSSCTVAKRARLTTKRQATIIESQEHLHIENYFTLSVWSMLRSSASMMSKLASVASFVVDTLGLHYPNESSIASIIGVVFAAQANPWAMKRLAVIVPSSRDISRTVGVNDCQFRA